MGMEKFARKKSLDRHIQAINSEIAEINQKIALLNQEAKQKDFNKEYSKYAAAQNDASKLDKLLYLGNAKLLKNEIRERKREIENLEGEKSALVEQRLSMQQEIDDLGIPTLSATSNLFRGR